MLNVFIYIIAFIIGTLLGSFCTLAVWRIPLKRDITHERSYCINCNHRLGFLDLIPVLSYLYLHGKCRYCGQKIRIRYLVLEILFGLSYLLFIISLNININNINVYTLINLLFLTIYLVILFLIAGIDKEYRNINKSVLVFGTIVLAIYIVYLYILGNNIYRYTICLILLVIFILLEYIYNRKNKGRCYALQIIFLIVLMLSFTNYIVMFSTILLTFISLLIKKCNISIGFFLCIYNIIFVILNNFLIN